MNDLIEQMKAEIERIRAKEQSGTADFVSVKLPSKGVLNKEVISKAIESTHIQAHDGEVNTMLPEVAVPSLCSELKPTKIITNNSTEPINEHKTLMTECECCDSLVQTPIEYKTLKLCQDCYDKEKSLEVKLKDEEPARMNAYEEINKMNEILHHEKEPIGKREDFFNAEKTEINLIEGSAFEKAQKIRERIDSWGQLLFEVQTKRNCGIIELNLLAQKLRVEEREKLKIQHIEYEPKEVKVQKPKTERMSKEDRTMLTIAQSMFGKKMLIGDQILSELSKVHSDWFKNGLVLEKFQGEVNKIVMDRGGLTLESAKEMVKHSISASRGKLFQGIASGEINLSGEKKS